MKNKIVDLETMKSNLENISEADRKEAFEQFVASQFTKVDQEERTWEKVMMIHALAFKQWGLVIEWLEEIKKYDAGWKQKRDYCLVKAADIMKWLKEGREPKRGNPNNEEEQEEFDTHEGNDNKQPIRASTGAGGSSNYPNLGPPPDLGLPGENDEESKSEGSDRSDRSDESSSEEEPPSKKTYQPKPEPVPQPKHSSKKGSTIKRDKNFYKGIEQAKKHCKNCISNLNYSVVDKSIEELEQALEILRELQ